MADGRDLRDIFFSLKQFRDNVCLATPLQRVFGEKMSLVELTDALSADISAQEIEQHLRYASQNKKLKFIDEKIILDDESEVEITLEVQRRLEGVRSGFDSRHSISLSIKPISKNIEDNQNQPFIESTLDFDVNAHSPLSNLSAIYCNTSNAIQGETHRRSYGGYEFLPYSDANTVSSFISLFNSLYRVAVGEAQECDQDIVAMIEQAKTHKHEDPLTSFVRSHKKMLTRKAVYGSDHKVSILHASNNL